MTHPRNCPTPTSSKSSFFPYKAKTFPFPHTNRRAPRKKTNLHPPLFSPTPTPRPPKTTTTTNTMGSPSEETTTRTFGKKPEMRKPRFLCLHGFRTSGEIMKTQILGKWPEFITSRLDLVFPDAPFPAEGKSEVEGLFPPPYYEWFQFNKNFTEYRNLDECFQCIEDLMIEHGPFDGVMGFSQGAILGAALLGLQARGLALTKVQRIKYAVIIAGGKFPTADVAEMAYSSKNTCLSLHFLGEKDFLRPSGELLLDCFVDPMVIHHPKGHTVPRILDEKSLETVNTFLKRLEDEISSEDVVFPPHEDNQGVEICVEA